VILQLEHQGRRALVSALGHEDDEDQVQMDFDLRDRLQVEPGDKVSLTVSEVGWVRQLRWYLFATDPAVRLPALLGAWSFAVGIIAILPIYDLLAALVQRVFGS
jgi:hypothetical protein